MAERQWQGAGAGQRFVAGSAGHPGAVALVVGTGFGLQNCFHSMNEQPVKSHPPAICTVTAGCTASRAARCSRSSAATPRLSTPRCTAPTAPRWAGGGAYRAKQAGLGNVHVQEVGMGRQSNSGDRQAATGPSLVRPHRRPAVHPTCLPGHLRRRGRHGAGVGRQDVRLHLCVPPAPGQRHRRGTGGQRGPQPAGVLWLWRGGWGGSGCLAG